MKKLLLFIILFLLFWNIVYWESNIDLDYTFIDCIDWDDTTWTPFDSSKPYQSLKWWIEKTITYINGNINKSWNEQTASGKVFNIKVSCTMNDLLDNNINLSYNWTLYNNNILIEWIWENSLIIENIKFNLSQNTWNIIFKNANFINYSFPYFYDNVLLSGNTLSLHPNSKGIKIIDSYIQLKNNNNLWSSTNYIKEKYINYNNTRHYRYTHYANGQYIENSIIDIDINSDYWFKLPVIIKNSKINFTNQNGTWSYNVSFLEEWNSNSRSKVNYSVLISNEIDLWWNNFLAENSSNLAFINNKFSNFNSFNFSNQSICFNNLIENNSSIEISNYLNLYNNVFKAWITDLFDIYNLRKNYKLDNIWTKWISWVYKKHNDLNLFNINLTSSSLYEEVTWQKVPELKNSVYVIYEN